MSPLPVTPPRLRLIPRPIHRSRQRPPAAPSHQATSCASIGGCVNSIVSAIGRAHRARRTRRQHAVAASICPRRGRMEKAVDARAASHQPAGPSAHSARPALSPPKAQDMELGAAGAPWRPPKFPMLPHSSGDIQHFQARRYVKMGAAFRQHQTAPTLDPCLPLATHLCV